MDQASVEVKNIGPMGHSRFVIRPLTLLVGKNGAGKTLTSTLLYALQRTLSGACERAYVGIFREIQLLRPESAERLVEIALNVANGLLGDAGFQAGLQESFSGEILRALGESRIFITHGRRVGAFEVNHELGWACEARFTASGIETSWKIPEIKIAPSDLLASLRAPESPFGLITSLLETAFGAWMRRPVMIPAGRVGITDSYRYLAEQVLLERHGRAGSGLGGVTRDFLAVLVGTESELDLFATYLPPGPVNPDVEHVSALFDDLIGGQLRPSSDVDELFAFHVRGNKIDRNVMSSMVKELGPMIVLLLQGLDQTNLIVDEPECHLHPKAQIDLARVFVSLVARQARFLLSTHSPYLAQSLSNEWIVQSREGLVRLNDMAVIAFNESDEGFRPTNLPLNEKFGFEFGDFVESADQVQDQFVKLFG